MLIYLLRVAVFTINFWAFYRMSYCFYRLIPIEKSRYSHSLCDWRSLVLRDKASHLSSLSALPKAVLPSPRSLDPQRKPHKRFDQVVQRLFYRLIDDCLDRLVSSSNFVNIRQPSFFIHRNNRLYTQ